VDDLLHCDLGSRDNRGMLVALMSKQIVTPGEAVEVVAARIVAEISNLC
jgi:hypothetical protein